MILQLHLLTLSKANLETAHEENQKYFKKQDEQREQQFIDTLKENEKKYGTRSKTVIDLV